MSSTFDEAGQKSVLNSIWEHNATLHAVSDDDDFTIRLARAYLSSAHRRHPVSFGNFSKSVTKIPASFFRINAVDREAYLRGLLPRLNRLCLPKPLTLRDTLLEFKRKVERDHVTAFSKDKPREDTGRHLLSAFLAQRTYGQVESGDGYIDLLLVEGYPIETKIWRGKAYFEEGLEELSEYMRTQGVNEGYYVIFDPTIENEFRRRDGPDSFVMDYEGRTVFVVFILIARVPPSKKLRRERNALRRKGANFERRKSSPKA